MIKHFSSVVASLLLAGATIVLYGQDAPPATPAKPAERAGAEEAPKPKPNRPAAAPSVPGAFQLSPLLPPGAGGLGSGLAPAMPLAPSAPSAPDAPDGVKPEPGPARAPSGLVMREGESEPGLAPPAPPPASPPAPVSAPGSAPAAPLAPVPSLPAPTTVPSTPGLAAANDLPGEKEFQGEDVSTVLRLLARQARINIVVSDQVTGTVSMRLESVTSMEAIKVIVTAKGLIMTQIENVHYVKTPAEQQAEPQEPGSYRFSYAKAETIAPLLTQMLQSKAPCTFDPRTNTIFYREVVSNKPNIDQFLEEVDAPTQQVMIESRLVEVTANPKQSYGINWSGVFGNAETGKTFRFFGTEPQFEENEDGATSTQEVTFSSAGDALGVDFLRQRLPGKLWQNSFTNFAGQMAILSAPQLSVTLRLLNEDEDAEFLANPRVVTADNEEATISITRAQPVPQLNFNEQTATAVFGGFEDKTFGNTLVVKPSINKDQFISLNVRPEISNKVGDETFTFAGAEVRSPVIDTRSLESNVLIQSGDTLAVGGLLQDETSKGRTKVPLLGDIPLVGYLFQERMNARAKRNLLIFVTPTIIDSRYGTGLESQAARGLRDSIEEFSDPEGWLNNARGVLRLAAPKHRPLPSLYPPPGLPEETKALYEQAGVGPRPIPAASPRTSPPVPALRDSVRARAR